MCLAFTIANCGKYSKWHCGLSQYDDFVRILAARFHNEVDTFASAIIITNEQLDLACSSYRIGLIHPFRIAAAHLDELARMYT